MKEAGLSVGLMYGGNGSGGGAGAMSGAPKADTGGAVAGQAANAAALMEVENQRKALALQQASMAKDIQLKDAEIRLKEKEADKAGKEALYPEALTETENTLSIVTGKRKSTQRILGRQAKLDREPKKAIRRCNNAYRRRRAKRNGGHVWKL